MFSRLGHWLLDLFYPPRCVACGESGAWWCARCRGSVEKLSCEPCPKCLEVKQGHECTGSLPFAGVVATGFYHSLPLRRLIAGIKYDGVTSVTSDVEAYLRDVRAVNLPWETEKDLIVVALPLADRRERERGFNQADWIADRMAAAWNISKPDNSLLIRRQGGVSAQADLAHDSALRQANVQGQFSATRQISSSVLLIDDVTTTGSTAAEAARVLLAAGAPKVYLAVLALGK